MSSEWRISVTLSGGAALGAYQAGAMAALAGAFQHLLETDEDSVWLDAIGGASAGSLVALFTAHALLEGIDPVELLHEAWVEKVSLELLSGGSKAPLDLGILRESLRDVLATRAETSMRTVAGRQQQPIHLHVALTGLQGLTYSVRALRRKATIPATTHADWGQFVLRQGGEGASLFDPEGGSPVDFVLASAAHPAVFPPQLLDRREDAGEFRARGVVDFPESGRLWYTDGGVVQSRPLGRVLQAARQADAAYPARPGARRVNIMIDPRSEGPLGATRWSDPDSRPDWLSALTRTVAILPVQSMYDDLREIETNNTRLEWAHELTRALMPHLGEGAEAALEGVLERIASDRLQVESASRDPSRTPREDERSSLERKLRRAVDEIAGLTEKQYVDVDVISPLLVEEEGISAPRLLAGEFMGDFGGFLSRDLRHSDFVLGYASARKWLPDALAHGGFEEELRRATLAAVDERSPGDWREVNLGQFGPSDLSWRKRWALGRLTVHTLRVLGSMALPRRGPGRMPGRTLRSRPPSERDEEPNA